MTDKAKERIQRACHHLVLLRVKASRNGDEWSSAWQCADCEQFFHPPIIDVPRLTLDEVVRQ